MAKSKDLTPKEVGLMFRKTARWVIKIGKSGQLAGFRKVGRRYFIDEKTLMKDLKRKAKQSTKDV